MEGSIRSTITIHYGNEARDLNVTFGLIDRIRRKVPWEKLALDSAENHSPDFAMMAKFIYLNMLEAGFDPNDIDIDEIYDEMVLSDNTKDAYINLVGQIISAYQPRGPKKKPVAVKPDKAKKSA